VTIHAAKAYGLGYDDKWVSLIRFVIIISERYAIACVELTSDICEDELARLDETEETFEAWHVL
jgi:hypothetical protein